MIDLILKIEYSLQQNQHLFENANFPPVAFIDRYRAQPLNPAQFSYTTPALFIETKTVWDKAGKAYNGALQINFHIITDAALGYGATPTLQQRFSSEAYYTILRSIFDDLDTNNTGKLTRLEEKSADNEAINYQIISYQSVYADPILVTPERLETIAGEGNLTITKNLRTD